MNVRYRSQFKRDYRLMMKRGLKIIKLDDVILRLAIPEELDEKHRNHPLAGEFEGCQECHVAPDWLLVYFYETLDDGVKQLVCVRTGAHSDFFC